MRIISFRLAIALSIIIAVAIVSVAAYYARQLSTTTTIKISPQEDTKIPSTTTSIGVSTSERKNILIEIGEWAITIALQSNGTGILRIEYVGEKPLTIENPLLPLTAGLDITLEYSNPSKNTVLKGLGTYYYNASVTIEHGNYSQIKFDARNLTSIRIEGKMLGKIPVRIYIPLIIANYTCNTARTSTVTVTVTRITSSQVTTIPETKCKLELIGEYMEPKQESLRKEVGNNQTLYTNSVMEIRIPLETYSTRIPLTIINRGESPIVLHKWYFEYEVINISFNGEHYENINRKLAYAVPTTTIPPWIMDCTRTNNNIWIWGRNDVLMPSQKTIVTLDIPDDILGNHDEVWSYIRVHLEYQGVKKLYRILLNDTEWKYSWAAEIYDDVHELNIVFKIHIVRR